MKWRSRVLISLVLLFLTASVLRLLLYSGSMEAAPAKDAHMAYMQPQDHVAAFKPANPFSNTICPAFMDVDDNDYFCTSLTNEVNANAIGGYVDPRCASEGQGSPCFLGNDPLTRGQIIKIIVNTFHLQYNIPPGQQDFMDVPPAAPFYTYIEIAFHQNPPILSGYTDPICAQWGVGSPCFLPNNYVTRGQLSKLSSNAANFTDDTTHRTASFADAGPPPNGTEYFTYIERGVMHDTIAQWPPKASPQPVCLSSTQPCFYPTADALRSDAAVMVERSYRFRTGHPGVTNGQVFTQYTGGTNGLVTQLYASVTTPSANNGLGVGDGVFAPVAITARWNPYFVEVGADEYVDMFGNVQYHPYWTWLDGLGSPNSNVNTSYPLTPGAPDNYQVAHTGNVWQMEYCPNGGCQFLQVSGTFLHDLPFAVTGAESSRYTLSVGTITVSNFIVTTPHGGAINTCFDPTLTPWIDLNGHPSLCYNHSWNMTYNYLPPAQ